MSNLYIPTLGPWIDLDLKEVQELTSIKLRIPWKYYFTNFHEGNYEKHAEDCPFNDFFKENTCRCTPEVHKRAYAILKAGFSGLAGVTRGRFFFCYVRADVDADIKMLRNPELRQPDVLEDLRNGLETLVTLLKVYEVTGKVLDFGPPLKIYKEDDQKRRQFEEEIDGDVLWNILHDIEQPKQIEA